MSIFLILAIGIYLGIGTVIGFIWCLFSILGNEVRELFIGLTAPISWPILILRMFFERS